MSPHLPQALFEASNPDSVSARVCIDGEALYATIGVEVGSLATFFSSEDESLGRGLRRQFEWQLSADGTEWSMSAIVAFQDGLVELREHGRAERRHGARQLTIRAGDDSLVMDAVLRFVVPAEQVESVRVGSEFVTHRSRNRYHQREMQAVVFRTRQGRSVRFAPSCANLPTGMSPVVYVRDELDQWVLHFRALSTAPDVVVLKGCHRLHNRPFPSAIQTFVRRYPGFLNRMLYIRERVSQRIPLQANGAVKVVRGAEFTIGVRWDCS